MMFGWEYVPDWFIWFVVIVVILFFGISYWVTSSKVDVNRQQTGVVGTKASYFENPLKVMTKPVEIRDMETNDIGYVKRNFDNYFQMILSFILPNYYVDVSSKDNAGNLSVTIHKLREKRDLLKSRWEAEVITKDYRETFIMESNTKITSGVDLSFPFRGEMINVSKNIGENKLSFYKNGKEISQVSYNKKFPPRNIFIDAGEGELPVLLLACIFEVVKLYK